MFETSRQCDSLPRYFFAKGFSIITNHLHAIESTWSGLHFNKARTHCEVVGKRYLCWEVTEAQEYSLHILFRFEVLRGDLLCRPLWANIESSSVFKVLSTAQVVLPLPLVNLLRLNSVLFLDLSIETPAVNNFETPAQILCWVIT